MLIGAGEIIRRSYHLYRANFRMYFKYILLNFVNKSIVPEYGS